MIMETKMITNKKKPLRTCIACRQVKEKRELVRIVCDSEGKVAVDISGRKAGRGAYLCPDVECWRQGITVKNINKALKASNDGENITGLLEYAESL